jgi:hypothetical protein
VKTTTRVAFLGADRFRDLLADDPEGLALVRGGRAHDCLWSLQAIMPESGLGREVEAELLAEQTIRAVERLPARPRAPPEGVLGLGADVRHDLT